MPMPTFLEMLQSQGSDGLAGLASDVAPSVPEIGVLPARPIRGTSYKQNVLTELPAGGFRDLNEGSSSTKGKYEQRQFDCYVANAVWMCDKAVADAHEDGRAAYVAAEGANVLLGQFVTLGRQLYYGRGTGGNAKGHPGLINTYDATNMVVDATGSTESTCSSVWFLKLGPMGIQWLLGNNGSLSMTDIMETIAYDAASKPYTALHQEFLAWVGMKQASLTAACRIKKLTEDAGKGLTDTLMGKALAKFPVGVVPDVCLMTRRSLEQLRASRTATNPTGAEAPTPTTFEGIPIVKTDSILNTETLAL